MLEVGRETGPGVQVSQPTSVDAAIAALAAKQHGVFALRQLTTMGLTAAAVLKRARAGRLHRVSRGVYSLAPPTLLTREGRWMAAVLAAGPGAALSHRSAAMLHGLMRTDRAKIDITIAGRHARRHPGIEIHRSKTLTRADVMLVSNILCTTLHRTLFDLADVESRRRVERAFDQAEVMGVLDLAAIQDQLARNGTRPAAMKTRVVLEEHYIGSTPTESELEEGFLALCRRAGLPLPEVQQWLILADGGPPIRADFLWREQRVVVEVDGMKYHGTQQATKHDARRDQRLIVHGYKPIRTGWKQVFFYPEELEATLKALVRS